MRLVEYYLKRFIEWRTRKEMLEGCFPSVFSEYQRNIDNVSPLKLRARDTFFIVMKLEKALIQLEKEEIQFITCRYFDPKVDTDEKAGRLLGWSFDKYYKTKRKTLRTIEDSLGIRTFTSWEDRNELYKEMEDFWNEQN